jgi:hypothetical protein
MSSGETWDDPSEDLLLELLMDGERGDETFVVVGRLSDQSDQTYAQVIRNPDGSWLLERRDGSPDEHYQLSFADMRDAHAALHASPNPPDVGIASGSGKDCGTSQLPSEMSLQWLHGGGSASLPTMDGSWRVESLTRGGTRTQPGQ